MITMKIYENTMKHHLGKAKILTDYIENMFDGRNSECSVVPFEPLRNVF